MIQIHQEHELKSDFCREGVCSALLSIEAFVGRGLTNFFKDRRGCACVKRGNDVLFRCRYSTVRGAFSLILTALHAK